MSDNGVGAFHKVTHAHGHGTRIMNHARAGARLGYMYMCVHMYMGVHMHVHRCIYIQIYMYAYNPQLLYRAIGRNVAIGRMQCTYICVML